jgi:hypothetical protein
MSKLTEAEKAALKARWDEYIKQHAEACARGEHVWAASKGNPDGPWRCKFCWKLQSDDNESRSGATPDGSGAPDPSGAIPKA